MPIPELISKSQPGSARSVALDNTGEFVFAALSSGRTEFYDLKNLTIAANNQSEPELVATLPQQGSITSIQVSADNQKLLTSGDGDTAKLWNLSDYLPQTTTSLSTTTSSVAHVTASVLMTLGVVLAALQTGLL